MAGGLLYVREWNNLQYVTSAAFLLAVYSDYLSAANAKLACPDGQAQPQELLNFAKSQADYILGKNPKSMSYIVGIGQNYPVHVHHRGASIPSVFTLHSAVECVQGFETWYHRPEANPNVIYGALVGGPDQNDNFSDDRSSYEQTEPTLSGTGPLVGLLSKLQSLNGIPSYNKGSPNSQPTIPREGANDHEEQNPVQAPEIPIKLIHSIGNTWTVGKTTYYRHKVVLKNTSQKPISDVKLEIEDLKGSVWGLIPTPEKNIYELPQWHKVLQPGSECIFIYVQGGPQANVSIVSYH